MPDSHRARKRFGQNFLKAPYVQQLIAAIKPTQQDNLVEIGPGKGALTQHLISQTKQLFTIELDRDLETLLREKFASAEHFHLYQQDVLTFDFNRLAEHKPLRIVGNLPYNISTPLLIYLLDYLPLFQDMHFMLQKEVATRIVSEKGSKQYGRLSVMMQYFCTGELLFNLPGEAFSPAPKVVSSFIRLIPRSKKEVEVKDLKRFEAIIRFAFQQRRKTIHNSLKKHISPDTFEKLNIDPKLRPEQLSVNDFVRISNTP